MPLLQAASGVHSSSITWFVVVIAQPSNKRLTLSSGICRIYSRPWTTARRRTRVSTSCCWHLLNCLHCKPRGKCSLKHILLGAIGSLLAAYWQPIGSLLAAYWQPIGILLAAYWQPIPKHATISISIWNARTYSAKRQTIGFNFSLLQVAVQSLQVASSHYN